MCFFLLFQYLSFSNIMILFFLYAVMSKTVEEQQFFFLLLFIWFSLCCYGSISMNIFHTHYSMFSHWVVPLHIWLFISINLNIKIRHHNIMLKEIIASTLKDIVYTSPWKLGNIVYNHLRRHILFLPWSWSYNCILGLENLLIW